MTNVCILEEFISSSNHIAVQGLAHLKWNYTGLYTITWIHMRKCENTIHNHLTQKKSENYIQLRKSGYWDLNLWNAISMFVLWLTPLSVSSPLTLKFSKHQTNCQMLLWKLGSLCPLTRSWINSIFADIATPMMLWTSSHTRAPPLRHVQTCLTWIQLRRYWHMVAKM